jgi:hypothetical protein
MQEINTDASLTDAPLIDEPMIVPPTVGETLETATRVLGALSRSDLGDDAATQAEVLCDLRQELLGAVESDDAARVGSTLRAVQSELAALYESVQDNAVACAALGFPTPEFLSDPLNVGVVDVSKVCVTFTIQGKQMLTSLAFPRAANAKFYWLHEVRHFAENPEERVEDPLLQSHVPLFDRIRLAPGTRILRIKTRNLSGWEVSEEFTVEVPQP